MRTLLLPVLIGTGITLPVAVLAQQQARPIQAKRLPAPAIQKTPAPPALKKAPAQRLTPPVFERQVQVARPGAQSAVQVRQQMLARTATFRKPRMIAAQTATIKIKGIGRVNGSTSGNFEPGGGYEITGNGFGTASGSAFLRLPNGRMLPLGVTHWSDTVIYAQLPDNVSGVPDSNVELAIGPRGKAPFKSTNFRFRAAREDINLPISNAMFRHEGAGSITLAGRSFPVNSPPNRRTFDGKWYEVIRNVSDGDEKKCISPGRDRISWGNLKNGFEVTSFYYERMPFRKTDNDTPRGSWDFAWDGNSIRVDFGVMRYYTPRYVFVGGYGYCSSFYKINLIATGPRGMSPV